MSSSTSGVATNLLGRMVEWSGSEGYVRGEVVGVSYVVSAGGDGRFTLLVAVSGSLKLTNIAATLVRLT